LMSLHLKDWPRVTLSGLAQVAFCDSPVAGALVLAAVTAVSPYAALGGLIGAFLGTLAAYTLHTWNRAEKLAGLPGPNPAIVGLLIGGACAPELPLLPLFVLAVAVCLAIEQAVRRPLARAGLPALSFPAILTTYLFTVAANLLDMPIWSGSYLVISDGRGAPILVALVVAALALKSPVAALQTAILSACTALLSGWIAGTGAVGPAALWGFTVAPAAFGVHAVFLAGSSLGGWFGLAAAVLAVVLWALWVISPLADLLPPFLLPFVLATWAILVLSRRVAGRLVLDPNMWSVAAAIRDMRADGRPVVVLTGAGVSTASGIPDYVSGAWLDPSIPASAYSWKRYLESQRCRRLYWEACERFRQIARAARFNDGHAALAELERRGWVSATITQNVDGLHQAAGATQVIELHGNIEQVRCVGCGQVSDWPAAQLWSRYDLRCRTCGDFLKPAVVAFGENLPVRAWGAAQQAARRCGVIIVVGSQLAVSPARDLVADARAGGAQVVIVNLDPVLGLVSAEDIVLPHRSEDVLPALARLLDCAPGRKAESRQAENAYRQGALASREFAGAAP